MSSRDPDLEKLTSLLNQCLGRLDADAFEVQQRGEGVDIDASERIGDETERLQELVDSLLVVEMGEDQADLNAIVAHATDQCLQQLAVPIVLRRSLACRDAIAAVPSSLASVAVQRSIALCADRLAAGDELVVTTRCEGNSVVIEIESLGSQADANTDERTETLRDFVDEMGGICRVRSNDSNLFVVLELPQVLATNRSDS